MLQIFRVVVASVIAATYYAPRQYIPVARIEKLPGNEAAVTTLLKFHVKTDERVCIHDKSCIVMMSQLREVER